MNRKKPKRQNEVEVEVIYGGKKGCRKGGGRVKVRADH